MYGGHAGEQYAYIYMASSRQDVPQRHYRKVTVRAYSHAGWGEFSDLTLVATEYPEPPLAPRLRPEHHMISVTPEQCAVGRFRVCDYLAVKWDDIKPLWERYALRVLYLEMRANPLPKRPDGSPDPRNPEDTFLRQPDRLRIGPYEPGTAVSMEVRYVNAAGPGNWSNTLNLTTNAILQPSKPGSPFRANMDGIDRSRVIPVRWKPGEGCEILRGMILVDGKEVLTDYVGVGCGESNTYVLRNLIPGTPHNFMVRLYNSAGWGNWSDMSTIWTDPSVPEIPDPPIGLSLNATTAMLQLVPPYNNGDPIDQLELKVARILSRKRTPSPVPCHLEDVHLVHSPLVDDSPTLERVVG